MLRLFTSLLLLTAFNSQGDVVLREHFEHYQIAPETLEEIKTELRKHSPVSRKQQIFHGGTEWNLVPYFRLSKERYLCHIRDVHVELTGTYTLPKLRSRKATASNTKARFDAYYLALMEHEKGHRDLWLDAGEQIERMLKNFEPFYDCQAMANEAKKRISSIIEEFQQKNRDYDTKTDHGRTQGAAI